MSIRLSALPRAGQPPGIVADSHDSPWSRLDRRAALRLTGGVAFGALVMGSAAACAEDESLHDPDPLAAQEVIARGDADAATAAIAQEPQRHAALNAIATERTAHADALKAEIARVVGVYGDGTTPVHNTRPPMLPDSSAGSTGSGAPQPSSPSARPSGLDELRTRLATAQRTAAELASSQSGYRAGLLASISAACAAQAGVLLA